MCYAHVHSSHKRMNIRLLFPLQLPPITCRDKMVAIFSCVSENRYLPRIAPVFVRTGHNQARHIYSLALHMSARVPISYGLILLGRAAIALANATVGLGLRETSPVFRRGHTAQTRRRTKALSKT